jgi:myo-inositol 2-dehydrogenase/D-chiro-inositol 1-dehydrogenase
VQASFEFPLKVTHLVVSRNLERGRQLASRANIAHVSTDLSDIFNSPDIDFVVVASSSVVHSHCLKLAAEAHKPIFCEKPGGVSLEELLEAKRALDASGTKHMIAFNHRLDPNAVRIKAALDSGEVGDIISLTLINRDEFVPPREFIRGSGGIFKDLAIHEFDMANFLIGRPVTQVWAKGEVKKFPYFAEEDDYDVASVLVCYEGGIVCNVSLARGCSYGYDQRTEVFGTSGTAVSQNIGPNQVEAWTAKGLAKDPLFYGSDKPSFEARYGESFAKEMKVFLRFLRGEDVKVPNIDDAIRAMQIADAATASAKSGAFVPIEQLV